MTRIAVLGGTGYTGSAVVREAAARGHDVVVWSRSAPAEPVPGVRYEQASLRDEDALRRAVADQDAVVEALAPRGELAGHLTEVVESLERLAPPARLVVIGGWSGLRPAPDAPRFSEGETPAAFRDEVLEMVRVLDHLEQHAPQDLDWLFVSPALAFGAHVPGEDLGRYRVGGPVALTDADGGSAISGADFARAVVDEIDAQQHRGHIGVAY